MHLGHAAFIEDLVEGSAFGCESVANDAVAAEHHVVAVFVGADGLRCSLSRPSVELALSRQLLATTLGPSGNRARCRRLRRSRIVRR